LQIINPGTLQQTHDPHNLNNDLETIDEELESTERASIEKVERLKKSMKTLDYQEKQDTHKDQNATNKEMMFSKLPLRES